MAPQTPAADDPPGIHRGRPEPYFYILDREPAGQLGSIWGGSAFKFGIYSRKDKTDKPGTASDSYSRDYAWYRKYGSTPNEAFAKVKSLVVQVAEAAARGDYAAIDEVDLGKPISGKSHSTIRTGKIRESSPPSSPSASNPGSRAGSVPSRSGPRSSTV